MSVTGLTRKQTSCSAQNKHLSSPFHRNRTSSNNECFSVFTVFSLARLNSVASLTPALRFATWVPVAGMGLAKGTERTSGLPGRLPRRGRDAGSATSSAGQWPAGFQPRAPRCQRGRWPEGRGSLGRAWRWSCAQARERAGLPPCPASATDLLPGVLGFTTPNSRSLGGGSPAFGPTPRRVACSFG